MSKLLLRFHVFHVSMFATASRVIINQSFMYHDFTSESTNNKQNSLNWYSLPSAIELLSLLKDADKSAFVQNPRLCKNLRELNSL